MKLVSYTQIRHLIPKKSGYYAHEKSQWAKDNDKELVWFHDGDFDFTEPLNLDEANQCLGQPENEKFPFFILINGHARFNNIFNAETDGSTGLVVLGNVLADNIVVGGQEVFVTGDLKVKDLFWGDYNHGSLTVKGKISTRVFINTDYGTDYKRFKSGDNIEIEHLLTDEQEDHYTEGDLLRALFAEKFINKPEDIVDDIYSWKDWLKDWLILEAMENNEPVLLKEWNSDFFPKEEEIPDFFESDEINEKNLLRFGESECLQPVSSQSGDALQLEYWVAEEFRRIHRLKANLLSTAVYMQHDEDFACMVYMGIKKSLLGKTSYICTKAYKELSDDIWRDLNAKSPEKYHTYLRSQWKAVLDEYTQMNYWWNRFQTSVTIEKFNAILALPLIQEKYNDANPENDELYFRSFIWSFHPKGINRKYDSRISIVLEQEDDEYDFYHFDLEEDKVVLYTQYDNEDGAPIYDVFAHKYEKVKNAVLYFEKLEKHIYPLNEAYLQQRDIEINRFDLTKSALSSLIKLCLSEPHLSAAISFLEKMTEDDLKEGFDLVDELRFFCEEHDTPFLVSLDWKAEREDFLYFLDRILKENFGLEIDLKVVSVPEDWPLDKVMQKYDRLLRGHGLQLGFANDYSDSYIFFVHRREAATLMDGLFEITEFDYQEAKDI